MITMRSRAGIMFYYSDITDMNYTLEWKEWVTKIMKDSSYRDEFWEFKEIEVTKNNLDEIIKIILEVYSISKEDIIKAVTNIYNKEQELIKKMNKPINTFVNKVNSTPTPWVNWIKSYTSYSLRKELWLNYTSTKVFKHNNKYYLKDDVVNYFIKEILSWG